VNTVIHLIRHGEVANPLGIRYGRRTGYRLSPRGEAQAHAAAAHLRPIARSIAAIVSSPLERTKQTAIIIQIVLELMNITFDDRVIEATSRFDGASKIAPLYPWNWRHLLDPFTPSWAEPFAAVGRRMHSAVTDLARRYAGKHVLLVSHQSPIWIARQSFKPRLGPPWLQPVRCAHASITSIELANERYVGQRYWAPPI
jgi:broad specificity phosphatase PhoE